MLAHVSWYGIFPFGNILKKLIDTIPFEWIGAGAHVESKIIITEKGRIAGIAQWLNAGHASLRT